LGGSFPSALATWYPRPMPVRDEYPGVELLLRDRAPGGPPIARAGGWNVALVFSYQQKQGHRDGQTAADAAAGPGGAA